MFRTLNEQVKLVVRQTKINEAYHAMLTLSFDLGVDFKDLLKELNAIDVALLEEEVKQEVKKKK